jgi:autotransporter-associated beta strand protein
LGAAHNITLSGGIGGTNLVKTGSGTLTLNSPGGNFYTNGTVISGGTLNINSVYALGGANYGGLTFSGTGGTLQYANPTLNNVLDLTTLGKLVTLSANATIDVNGNAVTNANGIGNGGNGGLIVKSTLPGGLLNLQGANTYTGNTTVNNGSTLELAQATIPTASTVTVNTGGVLQLDFAGSNNVNTIVLGGVTYTAPGTYNNANHAPFITGTGSLVISSSIANYSTNITATVNGSTLTVAWPATHLGWELMLQTNSLTTGLGNNWVTNYGTASVTSTNYPIDPANGSVFYKLVHP